MAQKYRQSDFRQRVQKCKSDYSTFARFCSAKVKTLALLQFGQFGSLLKSMVEY